MSQEDQFYLNQLASMLVRGRDPDYIAHNLDRPLKWVLDMAETPEISKLCADIRSGKVAEQTEEALWGTERTSLELQIKTPKALKKLWDIIDDEKASHSSQLKAIEMWLKHNDKMPQKEDAVAGDQPIIFTDEDWKRLQELEKTRETRLRLVASRRRPAAES